MISRTKMGAIALVLGLIVLVQLVVLSGKESQDRVEPDVRQRWAENAKPIVAEAIAEGLLENMVQWPARVSETHLNGEHSHAPEKEMCWEDEPCSSLEGQAKLLLECWSNEGWLHMHENEDCALAWMHFLEHQDVATLDNTLSVVMSAERKLGVEAKSNQNGGARMHLTPAWRPKESDPKGFSDMMGYWKPCAGNLPGNAEDFRNEITAFHLDHLLGFYRTPVVVPRFFEAQTLREMVVEDKDHDEAVEELIKVQSMLDRCGSAHKKGVEGAMVGWSKWSVLPLDGKHSSLKKKKLANLAKPQKAALYNKGALNVTKDSPRQARMLALENSAVNMFSILTGNKKKFSHSVFIAYRRDEHGSKDYGPLLYIDNDRSNWNEGLVSWLTPRHPLSEICVFPEHVGKRLLALRYSSHSIGSLAKEATDAYSNMYEGPILQPHQATNLDILADFLTDLIEDCIDRHGVERVLLPFELDQ